MGGWLETGFPDSGFYMDLDIFTPLKHFVVDPAGQNATAKAMAFMAFAERRLQEASQRARGEVHSRERDR